MNTTNPQKSTPLELIFRLLTLLSEARALLDTQPRTAAVANWNHHVHEASLKANTWIHGDYDAWVNRDEKKLRQLLAEALAGSDLTTTDGQLSDCSDYPAIDFLRDSPDAIAHAIERRNMKKVDANGGMELLKPVVIDLGMTATHNMPCAVLGTAAPAVIDDGVFKPSWKAQKQGWHLLNEKSVTGKRRVAHVDSWWKGWLWWFCFRPRPDNLN